MIEDIRTAATDADRATARLRRLIAEAMRQPDPNVSEIARAANVTRQTVYRWAAHDNPESTGRPYRDPAEAMREALFALLDVGAGPVAELTVGLRADDTKVMARRVLHGAKSAPPSEMMTDEQQAIISVGCQAAHHVLGPP